MIIAFTVRSAYNCNTIVHNAGVTSISFKHYVVELTVLLKLCLEAKLPRF